MQRIYNVQDTTTETGVPMFDEDDEQHVIQTIRKQTNQSDVKPRLHPDNSRYQNSNLRTYIPTTSSNLTPH